MLIIRSTIYTLHSKCQPQYLVCRCYAIRSKYGAASPGQVRIQYFSSYFHELKHLLPTPPGAPGVPWSTSGLPVGPAPGVRRYWRRGQHRVRHRLSRHSLAGGTFRLQLFVGRFAPGLSRAELRVQLRRIARCSNIALRRDPLTIGRFTLVRAKPQPQFLASGYRHRLSCPGAVVRKYRLPPLSIQRRGGRAPVCGLLYSARHERARL
jgi:hypothetical protein